MEDVKSVLDTVSDYTDITALTDWLRPKIMPGAGTTPTIGPIAVPATGTPPQKQVQPMPPPPITMGKGSTKDERKVNQGLGQQSQGRMLPEQNPNEQGSFKKG